MSEDDITGLIFDIQQFAVHDGPGCRTMVFMKGCPLACAWCANPEGRNARQEIMYSSRSCEHSHACITACPFGAITASGPGGYLEIDRDKCLKCSQRPCVEACPRDALRLVGRSVSAGEMIRLVSRDRAYWGKGGGLTITGGEPLAQSRFVTRVLKLSYKAGVSTALETCAYAPWDTLQKALNYLDWVIIDIKHMNPARHREGTGVGNRLILENIRRTVETGGPRVIIRIPVIPGFNDTMANMSGTAEFLRGIGQGEVNILPFHRLAISKYEQLGLEYAYEDVLPPITDSMAEFKEVFTNRGITCYVADDTPF